ncbi:MAG: ABC transporter ATP-binding protein, partial [Acidobacteria bacterium]|nr:ABC transporter ATP-binding protein [Acidobacteriota bacterium]
MALEVRNISFAYNGGILLKDANISFEKGQIYAIIGPNGAGKTTFLKILLSLLKPTSGDVFYDCINLKSFSYLQRAKIFSYLPQIPNFNPEDKLWEVAKRGDYPHRRIPPAPRPLSTRKAIAEEYLELKNLWGRKIGTLSGGEIQRGVIARVLIQDAPVMVFDEPLNHLD